MADNISKLELGDSVPILDIDSKDFQKELEFNIWSTQSSSDYRNDRERPYDGQPWTDFGERGKQEVKGLTMRDISDCLIKAMIQSSPPLEEYWKNFMKLYNFSEEKTEFTSLLLENQNKYIHTKVELGTWRYSDIYNIDWNNIDPLAICQKLTVEIEKMMGIFPNCLL